MERVQKPLQNLSTAQYNGNYVVFQLVETWVSGSDFKLENK